MKPGPKMKPGIVLFILSLPLVLAFGAAAEGPAKQVVTGQPFVADYYPGARQGQYGIIVLNGSAGGKNDFMAEKFNAMGYPVLSLAYMDWEGAGTLPSTFEMIPLEYFAPARQWLMDQPGTRDDGVILYGLSKGAELALVLAAHDRAYKAVIATAPSSVVWSGIPANPGDDYAGVSSSWSLAGAPVPFIPYLHRTEFRTGSPTQMLDWHQASLDRASNRDAARIDVANIGGPVLLFSGGKDTVWPSATMGDQVCSTIVNAGQGRECRHVIYPEAPHLLGEWGPAARTEMRKLFDQLNGDR